MCVCVCVCAYIVCVYTQTHTHTHTHAHTHTHTHTAAGSGKYAKRNEPKIKEVKKHKKKDAQAGAAAARGEPVLGGGDEVRGVYMAYSSMGEGVYGAGAGAGGAQRSVGGEKRVEDGQTGAGGGREAGGEQNGEVRVVDGEVVDECGQRISPANLLMAFYTSATQQVMPYMYASYMYVLYVCLICMPYMYALYVYLIAIFRHATGSRFQVCKIRKGARQRYASGWDRKGEGTAKGQRTRSSCWTWRRICGGQCQWRFCGECRA